MLGGKTSCPSPRTRLIWARGTRGSWPFVQHSFVGEGYGTECRCRASHPKEEITMGKLAIWAQLEAKPGKEQEVEKFLKSAQPLAGKKTGGAYTLWCKKSVLLSGVILF